jgi:hypothetical protein
MLGIIIHSLLAGKFRTHNPVYFLLMTIIGLTNSLLLFRLIEFIFHPDFSFTIWMLTWGLAYFVGILLLVNIVLSLGSNRRNENEDSGESFF